MAIPPESLSAQELLALDTEERVDEILKQVNVNEGYPGRRPSMTELANELNNLADVAHKDFSKIDGGVVELNEEKLKPLVNTTIAETPDIDYGHKGACELRFDVPCISRLRIEVYEPFYDIDGQSLVTGVNYTRGLASANPGQATQCACK